MNSEFALPAEFDVPPAARARHVSLLAAASARAPRRRVPRPLTVALAVVAVTAIVAPAFGVGRIVDAVYPDWLAPRNVLPDEVERRTGEPPRLYARTTYEGDAVAVQRYDAGDGRICVGTRHSARSYSTYCVDPERLFARGPVGVYGPVTTQVDDVHSDPPTWDRFYVFGVFRHPAAEVTVLMNDCNERPALVEEDVFLFTVPAAELRRDLWPARVRAYDSRGRRVFDAPLHTLRPDDTAPPALRPDCR